jgi:hypothetical protein
MGAPHALLCVRVCVHFSKASALRVGAAQQLSSRNLLLLLVVRRARYSCCGLLLRLLGHVAVAVGLDGGLVGEGCAAVRASCILL